MKWQDGLRVAGVTSSASAISASASETVALDGFLSHSHSPTPIYTI